MSVATETRQTAQHTWNTSLYSRIVEASIRGDELRVLFANHTWVTVSLDELLPGQRERANWERVTFSPHEVIVPTEDGAVEISGFAIRVLTDPEFAAHLDAIAFESAQRSGRQIRRWREERRMSVDELAHAAGIDAATLARVEQGDVTTSFPTKRQILAPLGHTLKDLALAIHPDEADSTGEDDQ